MAEGIFTPREEINMMEVHDCFSITKLVTYEDLHISERGKAGDGLESTHNMGGFLAET
jgi:acetyl-CoA C-acetyltransferase